MIYRPMVLLGTVLSLFSATSGANEITQSVRAGYSFFAVGTNFVDYEENSVRRVNGQVVDVETDSMINLSQQSGTFVSLSDDWGFYLVSSSTLGESMANESWVIDDTVLRTNKVLFDRQQISILGSRRFLSSTFVLAGIQYNSTEFRRFGASLTPASANFGLTEDTTNLGTESETVIEINLLLGLEKSSLFQDSTPGWRYQLQMLLGLPLLTNISNTEVSNGDTFSQSFSGIQGHLMLKYGYQFSKNIYASLNLDMSVSRRDAISSETTDSFGTSEFPDNTLVYVLPSLGLFWSF